MAAESDPSETFWQAINAFSDNLAEQITERWAAWASNHENRHEHEVVGALLARQATLASELASNPPIWNAHLAPLILRSMVENCITIAWILRNPADRAKRFIAYGLGQENLLLEQAKAQLRESGSDPAEDPVLESWESWINSQRFTFLTEVNVGSLGPNLREMADEAGMLDLHRNDFARWSGSAHNMWHHIVGFNLQQCRNPLHGVHRVPVIDKLAPNPVWLKQAAKYVDLALKSFDETTGFVSSHPGAVELLDTEFSKMPNPASEAHQYDSEQ